MATRNTKKPSAHLQVVGIDAEQNLLFLRGAVSVHNNGVVRVRPAVAAHG